MKDLTTINKTVNEQCRRNFRIKYSADHDLDLSSSKEVKYV